MGDVEANEDVEDVVDDVALDEEGGDDTEYVTGLCTNMGGTDDLDCRLT